MRQQRDGDTLILSGDIDNHSITREDYRTFSRHLATGVRRIVFTEVARVDSAAVSLLITAQRIMADTPPVIDGAPAALTDLLKLYRLHQWITLS